MGPGVLTTAAPGPWSGSGARRWRGRLPPGQPVYGTAAPHSQRPPGAPVHPGAAGPVFDTMGRMPPAPSSEAALPELPPAERRLVRRIHPPTESATLAVDAKA